MKAALVPAVLFAALVSPAAAQTIPAADPNQADGAYLKYIAMDSVGEVQLSQLALQKSQDPAVKSFAQKMIDDHTKAVQQAATLAKSMQVADFAAQPADDAQVEYAHISTYSGHDFDREYLLHNVEDHMSDIATTRHAMEVAKSDSVRTFERAQLMQLEEHLMLAQRASDEVAARRT